MLLHTCLDIKRDCQKHCLYHKLCLGMSSISWLDLREKYSLKKKS